MLAVDLKALRARVDVIVGLAVVAVSIVLAIVLHRTLVACSYIGGPPPPCAHPTDFPIIFRLGIVAAGLLAAGLIITTRWLIHRHRALPAVSTH